MPRCILLEYLRQLAYGFRREHTGFHIHYGSDPAYDRRRLVESPGKESGESRSILDVSIVCQAHELDLPS
jgi:hypothetical protein